VNVDFVRLCGVSSSLTYIADVVWSCFIGKMFWWFWGGVGLGCFGSLFLSWSTAGGAGILGYSYSVLINASKVPLGVMFKSSFN